MIFINHKVQLVLHHCGGHRFLKRFAFPMSYGLINLDLPMGKTYFYSTSYILMDIIY